MRVRNKGRFLFPKSVELDRDMMPGETALVLPDFEQSERIKAALASGSIELTTDKPVGTVRSKKVGGMVVALPPDADVEGDTYYTDRLDNKDLPPLVKQAEEQKQDENEEALVDDGLSHVVDGDHFPKDAIGSQLAQEAEEKGKLEEVEEAANETEKQVAEFAKRRGGARVKYVAQMTDLSAMREALNLVKTGKAKEALQEKIAELTKPRPIDL